MRQLDDVVGDCPSCNTEDGVTYRGNNEAACVSCGELFEIEIDDEPEIKTDIPAVPIPVPAPPPPPVPVAGIVAQPSDKDDIPKHIRKSRPWKWAHELGNTGNPYRANTRNFSIYHIYEKEPTTIEGCVRECVKLGHGGKFSFLLSVYEVTMHCVSSGLLVMDKDTRIISPCKGQPVPLKVT